MDEVLKLALRLDDPEAFMCKLQQPVLPPDILYEQSGEEEDAPKEEIDEGTQVVRPTAH